MEFGDKSVPGSAIGGINQTMSEIEVEGALNSTGMVRAIVGSSQSAKDSPPTNGAVITNFDSLGLGTGAAAQIAEARPRMIANAGNNRLMGKTCLEQ